jgi:succinate dehydrogenase / fumarate reductase flavoprotein subunit
MFDIKELQTIEHDVLVVGAGGAGIRAAIECAQRGMNTGMISKSLLGKAHTVMAEGGMAAALGNVDSRDNWKIHFRDTMRGGKFLNQWRMAELHAQQAPERVRELEDMGAVFDRTKNGLINQRNFGGHRYPRLAHVGDRTGLEMIRTLQDFCIHQGIATHMECIALDVLTKDGVVNGLVAYWRETGRFILFKTKAIIFATGGAGRAWSVTSNSWEYTGDGVAMAYRCGAELMDLEFTQFHPTGMVWPPSVKGILVTEGVRGEGGILLNNKNERFMFNYIPEKFAAETADTIEESERWFNGDNDSRRPPELLTRDVVARAIMNEVKEGRGSEHGGVYLDIASRRPTDYIKKKLPSMYHQFKELAEVDITTDAMEVGPTLHYFMGGIRVDHDTQQTNVPGLFACGECAAGLHGANRLGGNSLSDLLVFGKLSGEHASDYANKHDFTDINTEDVESIIRQNTDILNREDGPNPYSLNQKIQSVMNNHVGIVREENELKEGIKKLENLKEEIKNVKAHAASQYNPGWNLAIDINNMIIACEAVAKSALERQESRGAHTRLDFSEENKDCLEFNLVIKKAEDGLMDVRKEPRKDPSEELKTIAHSTLEELENA